MRLPQQLIYQLHLLTTPVIPTLLMKCKQEIQFLFLNNCQGTSSLMIITELICSRSPIQRKLPRNMGRYQLQSTTLLLQLIRLIMTLSLKALLYSIIPLSSTLLMTQVHLQCLQAGGIKQELGNISFLMFLRITSKVVIPITIPSNHLSLSDLLQGSQIKMQNSQLQTSFMTQSLWNTWTISLKMLLGTK